MFINNKYSRWYMNIILKSDDVKIKGKTELHHILPKSIYPEYADLKKHKWNGVYLTFKEHFICHLLLEKMYIGKEKSKMFYALVRMFNGKHQFSSRLYEQIKKRYNNYHWSKFKSSKEVNEIYTKRGYQGDNFAGAHKWLSSLSPNERKAHYKKQANSRCVGWWISRKDNSIDEFYVLNLKEWCINNDIDSGYATSIANINSKHYGNSTKGWRIRKDGDPPLPPYFDKRKIGHENVACKGKHWKLVDGKRVWYE